jgi:hypothetical protein
MTLTSLALIAVARDLVLLNDYIVAQFMATFS